MFNLTETPTPAHVVEEHLRIATETLISLDACLSQLSQISNTRISETIWLSYFLDKISTDGRME